MCGAPGRPIVPSRGLRVLLCRMLIPIAATASAAALGAWAYGTYGPNGSLFGRAVGRGPTRERVAYLTFDDGPNPGATEPILGTLACRPRRSVRACAASSDRVPSSCCTTAMATIREATGAVPRPRSRGSSRMRGPRDIPCARSESWSCEVPGGAVARMAARPGGRRPGAQVLHRLPVAGDLRGAAGRRSVAPRRRVGGEPLVARGQGVGLAPHSEARRAPQLARGPGGQPGGRGGERPVRRGGGRGRARAPDRTAGRGAGGRRGVVGRVDPRGGGAGPRLVSRDGAERAAARAVAAGSTDRGGAGARGGAVARVGTRLGVACRPVAGIAPVAARRAANHGSGRSLAVADGLCALQLGRPVGHVSPRAASHPRAGVAGRFVHRPHRREPGWAAAAYAREHRRHPSGAGCGPVAVRRGARERGRGRVGAARPTGTARAVPGGDGDGLAGAPARMCARLKSDGEREKRVTRLPHGRLLSARVPHIPDAGGGRA